MAGCKRPRTRQNVVVDSKRPRTEEKSYVRIVTIVKEKVGRLRVRLFKWNETLLHEKFSQCGIIVTRVKKINGGDGGCGAGGILDQQTSLFMLDRLQRGCEDSLLSMFFMAFKEDMDDFLEQDTIKGLAEEVVSYISSNFRFTRRSLSDARTGRIVLFIEVGIITTQEQYRIIVDGEEEGECDDKFESETEEFDTEETRGEEDDDNEEEEEERSFVDFNRAEEDEEEFDMLTSQDLVITEDRDCQSGLREEDGGQEHDCIEEENNHWTDQPLVGVDQSENHPVESNTEETGREVEETEQFFEDFYEFEPESDTDETGEAEQEEEYALSDPERTEIEDLLWKLNESSKKITRVDPDRSRDSRGLKQVKEAMEIIKKESCTIKDKEMDPCSLCLEELGEGEEAVARTRCCHLFHKKCLCSWLSRKNSCPLCRSRCATLV